MGIFYKYTKNGYIIYNIDNKNYRAHRLAWFIYYGIWPQAHIDHINGVRDDNRICNLREVTVRKNQQNLRCHREGKVLLGAHWDKSKKKWTSNIRINGKSVHLGTFKTSQAAHEAYFKAVPSD